MTKDIGELWRINHKYQILFPSLIKTPKHRKYYNITFPFLLLQSPPSKYNIKNQLSPVLTIAGISLVIRDNIHVGNLQTLTKGRVKTSSSEQKISFSLVSFSTKNTVDLEHSFSRRDVPLCLGLLIHHLAGFFFFL